MNATARARLNVALSMTIFGTLPLFVRQVHASSAMIALMRAAIALIVLAAVYFLRGGRGLRVESKKEMLLLLASGAAMGVNWILLFEAYNYVSVQIATLLYYFAPVIVAAASAALNSFSKVLLASHIKTCVAQDIRAGKDETIDELLTTLQKLMR